MDVRGLAKLWCSVRCDPALCGNADATHPTQSVDQLIVRIGKEGERFVAQCYEIPLDRPVTSRFEVEQQGAVGTQQPVRAVRASVQWRPSLRKRFDCPLKFVDDAQQEPAIDSVGRGRAMRLEKPPGVIELQCKERKRSIESIQRLVHDLDRRSISAAAISAPRTGST